MKKLLIILFTALFLSCTDTNNQNNTESNQSETLTSIKDTIVNKEYFYPEEESETSKDTLVSGFKVHTEIYPIKDRYQTLYSGGDKFNYREYELKIRIQNSHGDLIADRLINKHLFDSLFDNDLDYYFLRGLHFIEFKNNEFRFDIKLGYTNHEYEDSYWIEYFVSIEGDIRFKDQSTNLYKKVIENRRDENEQIMVVFTVPDTITDDDFKNFPITVLKEGDIWLMSEFGKEKFKFIESDIKGFDRSNDKIWFYNLLDGVPQIYSAELSVNKEIEWHVTIKNDEDYEHIFVDEMYGADASLYLLSDTSIALECDPAWPFPFENLFVYTFATKELNFYSGQIPESLWNTYPPVSEEAKELNKLIKVETRNNIEDLYIQYSGKKIRLTDTKDIPREYEGGGEEIEFRISHNGTKMIYYVVEAIGDFMHGTGYIVNIDGTHTKKIFSDAFGDLRYWNRNNDNLYILEEGTLSVVYGKENRVLILEKEVEQFKIEQ